MFLKIWPKCEGAASIDPDCLAVLTYARLTKVPLTVKYLTPNKTITGTLPELEMDENVYSTTHGILDYFRLEKYNADFHLTPTQHSDTLAFSALLQQKLKPAFVHALWIDAANYVAFTRPAYAKAYGFFHTMYNLPRMHRQMQQYVNCIQPGNVKEKEQVIYKNAKECITLLSKRLGENKYFFGDVPTTLDVIVYGYLSILLKPPALSSTLAFRPHLMLYSNLCSFVDRITIHCFTTADIEMSNASKYQTLSKFPVSLNQTTSIFIGIAAMVIYAMATGILKQQFHKNSRRQLADNSLHNELD